ncbi:hypothetical protein BKA81DRAFT_92600 [Phyllosticta paracitricarpa]
MRSEKETWRGKSNRSKGLGREHDRVELIGAIWLGRTGRLVRPADSDTELQHSTTHHSAGNGGGGGRVRRTSRQRGGARGAALRGPMSSGLRPGNGTLRATTKRRRSASLRACTRGCGAVAVCPCPSGEPGDDATTWPPPMCCVCAARALPVVVDDTSSKSKIWLVAL